MTNNLPDNTPLSSTSDAADSMGAADSTDALDSSDAVDGPVASVAPVAGVPAGPLAGRVAVITGAGAGIGAATAHRFAAAGASVALLGRRSARLDDLAATLRKEHPAEVLPLAVDVADPAALATAAATIRTALGRPDLVVANAGTMLGAPFTEADTAEWDRMIG